jgi:hypothetical protein
VRSRGDVLLYDLRNVQIDESSSFREVSCPIRGGGDERNV